jgi:hypothetical protein
MELSLLGSALSAKSDLYRPFSEPEHWAQFFNALPLFTFRSWNGTSENWWQIELVYIKGLRLL